MIDEAIIASSSTGATKFAAFGAFSLAAEAETAVSTKLFVSIDSPIYPLTQLADGWDGYRAQKPSPGVLEQAQECWSLIEKTFDKGDRPQVSPGRDDIIAFAWSQHEPKKRLDVFIDSKGAEWVRELNGQVTSGKCISSIGFLRMVRDYIRA